jgi:hypothetical protein
MVSDIVKRQREFEKEPPADCNRIIPTFARVRAETRKYDHFKPERRLILAERGLDIAKPEFRIDPPIEQAASSLLDDNVEMGVVGVAEGLKRRAIGVAVLFEFMASAR